MEKFTAAQREVLEKNSLLCSDAAASEQAHRQQGITPDQFRTSYQRDRDKIVHTKSFRRLSHKTQVFLAAEGDHFRTRLTHTLEVSQIARTIARALRLNEDLVEAISLGHDLGHTPFGHAGERALTACLMNLHAEQDGVANGGDMDTTISNKAVRFCHNEQSLRVVDVIEPDGSGLKLTDEVRDGILRHTGSIRAKTMEGRIVAIADRIAYVNHDIDDAIRSGILTETELPESTLQLIGRTHSQRIETLVTNLIDNSVAVGDILMDDSMWDALCELRSFMFRRVYLCESVYREQMKAIHVVSELFEYFINNPQDIPAEYKAISGDDESRAVIDYVAGMTDRYARSVFEDIYIPRPWR